MPRRSTPPKYSRHSSGQARVRIRGKVHHLGPYNSPESREQYAKLIAEYLNDPVQERDDRKLTVDQFALAYLQFAKGYYVNEGEPTAHVYAVRAALRYLVRRYRNEAVCELSPKKLREFGRTVRNTIAFRSRVAPGRSRRSGFA